ncbi:hypothetical protein Q0Z83_029310 [Actinoplanes sichuanensis]|nr:hypothetical protein Q0Z83_029310 [Actinoplanes sichuanensis]
MNPGGPAAVAPGRSLKTVQPSARAQNRPSAEVSRALPLTIASRTTMAPILGPRCTPFVSMSDRSAPLSA